ncbi:6-pyruvoyl tetrahydrobiopterin synthase-like [Tropilaelaps mercedesae]|uniref:6-pyruvoyl tetrahydrobiopterin synthase n=1 Tax=Tropilaelaps mercedesae TaxID=418985 RepID=A0A1V9XKR3_9ACAR|nr:6-pyruvoyl tetrahydrobiopterin synthase-like [Tropilaelaps mercedesae]
MVDFFRWLSRNDTSRNAYCIVCKRDICGSMTMIKRHARTGKHQDNVTNYSGKDQHFQHLQLQQLHHSGKQQQQHNGLRYMLGAPDGTTVGTGPGEHQVVVVSEASSMVEGGTGNGAPAGAGAVFVTEGGDGTDAEAGDGGVSFGVDGGVALEDEYSPVDSGEVYVTICRTEQFSASHRLHCPELTPFKNQEIFGKCNNPNGHGHNYKFEVALTGPIDKTTGMVTNLGDLKRLLDSNVLALVDHKNLDLDVPYFKNVVSTAENIAIFIWRQLRPVIDQKLHIRVSVFETDKNKAVFPAFI